MVHRGNNKKTTLIVQRIKDPDCSTGCRRSDADIPTNRNNRNQINNLDGLMTGEQEPITICHGQSQLPSSIASNPTKIEDKHVF